MRRGMHCRVHVALGWNVRLELEPLRGFVHISTREGRAQAPSCYHISLCSGSQLTEEAMTQLSVELEGVELTLKVVHVTNGYSAIVDPACLPEIAVSSHGLGWHHHVQVSM